MTLKANEFEFYASENLIPKGFVYPESYVNFIEKILPNIIPWEYFFDKEEIDFFAKGLRKRYPSRTLVPFARRGDNDDVACFDGTDISGNPRVIIIHDWASPGWENRGEFDNFLEWLEFAKEQAEEWKSLGGV